MCIVLARHSLCDTNQSWVKEHYSFPFVHQHAVTTSELYYLKQMALELEPNRHLPIDGAVWWLFEIYDIFNTLRPRQNGRHFADDTSERISLNENIRNSITISLKFVLNGPVNNILLFVQIMAWLWPGNKTLSEPMMVILPTLIIVTRTPWVNYNEAFIKQNLETWNDFHYMILTYSKCNVWSKLYVQNLPF